MKVGLLKALSGEVSATCTRTLQTLSSVCLCVPHTEGMRRFSLVELLHAGLGVNIPSYCVCWNTHTNISNWLYRSSYIPNPFLSSFFCACTLVCLSVCCQPVSSYSTDVRPWGLPLLPTMLCYRLTLPRSAKKKTELENLFRSFPTAGTRTDTHTDTHGVKEGVICLTLGYTSPMRARVVVSAGVTVSRATLLEKRHLVVHAKYSILCILWICAAVMSAYHADTDLCTFALNLWIILVSKLLFPDYLNHFIWR